MKSDEHLSGAPKIFMRVGDTQLHTGSLVRYTLVEYKKKNVCPEHLVAVSLEKESPFFFSG
jgi:hypothetical protein